MANPLALTGGDPIPGDRVPMSEAKERAGHAVPVLPSELLSDPCTGVAQPVTLHDVWVGGQRPEPVLTATTYNLGLWMRAAPLSIVSPQAISGDELAPVDQAFSPDDFPDGGQTDAVRGHTAWVGDPKADPADDPSCQSDIPLDRHRLPELPLQGLRFLGRERSDDLLDRPLLRRGAEEVGRGDPTRAAAPIPRRRRGRWSTAGSARATSATPSSPATM